MEVLIELVLEIFGQFILEILAMMLGSFVKTIDRDERFKNTVKNIIAFVFFGLSIVLLIVSIIYKKTFLIVMTLVYLLLLIISHLFKYINKNFWQSKIATIIINWYRRIIKYSYPILLIIFGSMYLVNKSAIIWLIVLSSIALFVYVCIDIYRIYRFYKRKKEELYIYY